MPDTVDEDPSLDINPKDAFAKKFPLGPQGDQIIIVTEPDKMFLVKTDSHGIEVVRQNQEPFRDHNNEIRFDTLAAAGFKKGLQAEVYTPLYARSGLESMSGNFSYHISLDGDYDDVARHRNEGISVSLTIKQNRAIFHYDTEGQIVMIKLDPFSSHKTGLLYLNKDQLAQIMASEDMVRIPARDLHGEPLEEPQTYELSPDLVTGNITVNRVNASGESVEGYTIPSTLNKEKVQEVLFDDSLVANPTQPGSDSDQKWFAPDFKEMGISWK